MGGKLRARYALGPPDSLAALVLAISLASGCASREPAQAPTPTPDARGALDSQGPPGEPDDGGEPVPAAERTAIHGTIQRQLDALARDDGATAFSFAAPAIQRMFGTPENFLHMVHAAYAGLVRPRSVRFVATELVGGEVTQKVLVVTSDGQPIVALFLMDRQPDGQWKILGCVLGRGEETVA